MGVTERVTFAFACQYIVSPRGRTGPTVLSHTRQALASTLSARHVAATSYCHPGRRTNVVTPLFCLPPV